jgi:hypothetical protein
MNNIDHASREPLETLFYYESPLMLLIISYICSYDIHQTRFEVVLLRRANGFHSTWSIPVTVQSCCDDHGLYLDPYSGSAFEAGSEGNLHDSVALL